MKIPRSQITSPVILLFILWASAGLATVSDITALPEFSSLAPCARTAVSANVQGLTAVYCPSGVSALQSCACTKMPSGVLSSISRAISFVWCGTTATEDISSASSVFQVYCHQVVAVTVPVPTITNPGTTLTTTIQSHFPASTSISGPETITKYLSGGTTGTGTPTASQSTPILSNVKIIGIAVGGAVGVIIIAILMCCCCVHRRQKRIIKELNDQPVISEQPEYPSRSSQMLKTELPDDQMLRAPSPLSVTTPDVKRHEVENTNVNMPAHHIPQSPTPGTVEIGPGTSSPSSPHQNTVKPTERPYGEWCNAQIPDSQQGRVSGSRKLKLQEGSVYELMT